MSFDYYLSGRVYPEGTNVTVNFGTSRLCVDSEELDLLVSIHIDKSQVAIVVKTEKEIENIYTLRNYVETIARGKLDALGFVNRCGYDLELNSVFVGGKTLFFEKMFAGVLGATIVAPATVDQITKLSFGRKPHLRFVLSGFREALRNRQDANFFCYRIFETMQKYFKGNLNDTQAWNLLRDKLQLSKEDIFYIKNYADPVRHGESIPIEGPDSKKIYELTLLSIEKFIKLFENE